MTWTFNDVRIYANTFNEKNEKDIARLQPLSGNTILHIFGNNTKIATVAGLVVTDADKNKLQATVTSGVAYVFSGPEGIVGNYILHNMEAKRTPIVNICILDRPSLPSDSPVYDVSLELYIDG